MVVVCYHGWWCVFFADHLSTAMADNIEEMFQPKQLEQCIIHHGSVSTEDTHVVTLKDYASWKTLLDAAKLRNHVPILQIAKSLKQDEIPNLGYHRQCRSLFTMKRDLEALKRKAEHTCDDDNDTDTNCEAKRLSRTVSVESRIYARICIFCEQVKYVKRTQTREKLVQATQLRVDERLRDCAIQKGDEKIIAITSRDIIAA